MEGVLDVQEDRDHFVLRDGSLDSAADVKESAKAIHRGVGVDDRHVVDVPVLLQRIAARLSTVQVDFERPNSPVHDLVVNALRTLESVVTRRLANLVVTQLGQSRPVGRRRSGSCVARSMIREACDARIPAC